MNPKKTEDRNFSSFAMGATVGVIAALLFGTEEGRKLVKEILDVIPDKYKKVPEVLNPFVKPEESVEVPRTPLITPQETAHHATYEFHSAEFSTEAPPPPPPAVHPYRPQ